MLFSRFVWVALLAIIAIECVPTAEAARRRFVPIESLPGRHHAVIPPYPKSEVASSEDYRGAKFRLTECRIIEPNHWELDRPPVASSHRTVGISVPGHVNLLDNRIVNGLVLEGLHFAWLRCFSATFQSRFATFSGVRVRIFRNDELAIETERSTHNALGREIKPGNLIHHLKIQLQREEQARIAAENEKQRLAAAQLAARERAIADRKLSRFFNSLFWFAIIAALLFVLVKYGAQTIAFIRYFFLPHPARYSINTATQRQHSSPIDGLGFAESMQEGNWINQAEADLRVREMHKMTKRVEKETEYLRAKEDLARKVAEMELARVRVNTFERGARR